MIKEQKQKIRDGVFAKRDELSLSDIMEKSKIIRDRFFATPEFKAAQTVFVYSSFQSEVRTAELIEEVLCMGKKVVIPITLQDEKDFKIIKVESSAGLMRSRVGIPEPKVENKEECDPKDIDLIVAPGVAFTKDCKRLGQGWGCFDRFFTKTNAKRVGIGFDLQLVDDMPMEWHDQLVDLLVTESCVYRRVIPRLEVEF